MSRLRALRASRALSSEHVRLAAEGLGVTERTVWRWLDADTGQPAARPPRPNEYLLSQTDREAFAHFRGNVAAVERARAAVSAGRASAAGAPLPQFLVTGWAGAPPVALRTLQRAFAGQMTPAERAYWREGEQGRREHDVYLKRPKAARNQWWELDNKQLPILVLPPRGPAVAPWLVTVIDDGTPARWSESTPERCATS